jgi:hypothetical protein
MARPRHLVGLAALRLAFAAFGSLLAIPLVGSGDTAAADCCMGPPIMVGLPVNHPLSYPLRPAVFNDDPDHPADGLVRALLNVRGKRIADLGEVSTHASTVPHEIAFAVPAAVRARALRAAGAARQPRGVVKFVIRVRGGATGAFSRAYGMDAFVTLRPPIPTRGPTKIGLGAMRVEGSGERLQGSLLLHTPNGWPRTSAAGALLTTYDPLAMGAGCRANVYAEPLAVVTRSIRTYLRELAIASATVASGDSPRRRWRLIVTAAAGVPLGTTAAVLVPIERRRYVGVRIDVGFSPGCAPARTRDPSLISALRHAMTTLGVRARIGR